MEPRFFNTQQDLRKWFLQHHDSAKELFLGLYKVSANAPSVTYKQAVDEALCFGWIDGVVRRLDDQRRVQRFTPRKPKSIWSQVNIKRVGELTKLGLMHESGLNTFKNRDVTKQNKYSFEQTHDVKLDAAREKKFKANKKAWEFWQQMPKSYTKAATWWVISAKQEATKDKRLGELIECSANGLKIKMLRRPTDKQP